MERNPRNRCIGEIYLSLLSFILFSEENNPLFFISSSKDFFQVTTQFTMFCKSCLFLIYRLMHYKMRKVLDAKGLTFDVIFSDKSLIKQKSKSTRIRPCETPTLLAMSLMTVHLL